MAGIRKLRAVQIGWEGTPGTAVPATAIWRIPAVGIKALDDIQVVEEDIADYGQRGRTIKVSQAAQMTLPDHVLTYEQFPYLLHMGVEAQQTGAADGAGSGKVYTHDFGLTSASTLKTATVEAGNNQKVYEMEYVHCPEFSVRGAPGEPVMVSGRLYGRQRTAASFTGSLSLLSVDEAIFNTASLYLDAVGGTMGNTQATSVFMGFVLNVQTGVKAVQTADGNLYFTTLDHIGWLIEGEVTFRHIAAADTEDGYWVAETHRLLEIKLEGPALGTAGTTYSKKTVRFQLPIVWTDFTEVQDSDGNDVLTGSFRAIYDSTASLGPKIVVVNETASYWT